MARNESRWTLEDLIDFEQLASTTATAAAPISQASRAAALAAIHGLDGVAARRAGLRAWLVANSGKSAGRKFSEALGLVTMAAAIFLLVAGITAVLALLDRERGGIHVILFLGVLIGGQWLILMLATATWLLRWRATGVLGYLTRRIYGQQHAAWWDRMVDSSGSAKAALLWRLAGVAQVAGVFFNIGLCAGLAGLVMVKHIGFYWETTTEATMHKLLEVLVNVLAAPWSSGWPAAVPSASVINASRFFPGQTGSLAPGPAAWWEFLLMTILIWGLLPRLLLWVLAGISEKRALACLDFQARHHRVLWRELTGLPRSDSQEKPLDGVLVLDVGGCGISESALRPFLLQRLRVNPTAWHSTAVLDQGAEADAARSLALAPAGVVLLAEGWSLSIPRMTALHAKIRASAASGLPIKFLVVNTGPDSAASPVPADEQREWTRFVDALRDPAAEVFFYEA